MNYLRKKCSILEDVEDDYGLLVDSYFGVIVFLFSDDELENVYFDIF